MPSVTKMNSSEEKLQSTPHRRGVRVKFAYLFDKDEESTMTQTTVIKSEPCFQVIAIEDHVTKDFYQNKVKQHGQTQLMVQSTSIESDSLEDEYSSQSKVICEEDLFCSYQLIIF